MSQFAAVGVARFASHPSKVVQVREREREREIDR